MANKVPSAGLGEGAITIQIDSRKVTNMLTGYEKNLPSLRKKIIEEIGEAYVEELQAKAPYWSGHLKRNIRFEKSQKGGGSIVMPVSGIFQEQMRPHFVNFRGRPRLRKWAEAHNWHLIKRNNRYFGGINVKPHPWMAEPLRKAGVRRFRIIKDSLKKFINTNGRRS